jgi:hypothetical protein
MKMKPLRRSGLVRLVLWVIVAALVIVYVAVLVASRY